MLICKSLVEEKKIHYLKDLEILPVCVRMNSFKSLQEKKRVILRQEMKSVLASPTNLLGVRPALSSPFPPVLRTIQLEASDRHRGELTAGIYTVRHDHSYFQHLTLKSPAHFLVGTWACIPGLQEQHSPELLRDVRRGQGLNMAKHVITGFPSPWAGC